MGAVGLDMADRSVAATSLLGNDRPSARFLPGRICDEPGCETRLSIYNDGHFCALHQPMSVPRTRGRKIA